MKKVFYIISDIDKALAFEWISDKLDDRFELNFILLNPSDSQLERHVSAQHSVWRIEKYSGLAIISAWFSIFKLLVQERPQTVHCHMRKATLLGISAAYFARVKKRIYTRHNSTYNHVYHPHAVKYDRLANRLSTHVVAISDVVKDTLISREQTPSSKVIKIPHGFDLESFNQVSTERVTGLRERWNIQPDQKIIGVVSRQLELKGIQYIIPAFEKLLTDFPELVLVLANSKGPFKKQIDNLLDRLDPKSYRLLAFEPDMQAMFHAFYIHVHVPIEASIEAFGQTYVEALAASTPSVFTLSGIAHEFIEDEVNALVVPYIDSDAISEAILKLLSDSDLYNKLKENGPASVEPFKLSAFIKNLEELYDN